MECSIKGCTNKATHRVAILINACFPEEYRIVCKKCGKKRSLEGFHLVKDNKL